MSFCACYAGKPVGRLGILSAAGLKERLDRNEVVLVYVRELSEWEEGYVDGAKRIYVRQLVDNADLLPGDRPIAVSCSVRYRGSLGTGLSKRLRLKEV